MKAGLQFRLSQSLALTPQLQQSIRLLQLSTLELHQEVGQMLELNPFLEVEDEAEGAPPAPSADAPEPRTAEAGEASAGEGTAGEDDRGGLDGLEFGATEREDWENGTERDDFDGISELPSTQRSDEDDTDPLARSGPTISLADHLRDQLRGMRLEPSDAAAVDCLIDSLDEDGYLADPLEEIAARLVRGRPDENGELLDEVMHRLRCALSWLQSLEPTGVGARSLSECLVLQLRSMPPRAVPDDIRAAALAICREHLDLLARKDFRKLMAATSIDEALLRAAQALIVTLEPKPGRAFTHAEGNVIVPDVIVQRAGRGWRVVLNPDVMPKLRINDMYARVLKEHRGQHRGGDGAQALASRLQEARWFVKNIQQRFDTILRVSQAIVERQKNFFHHGEIAMKPLVLREIADELGLHESTISRVTTAKYISTPYGTFELKYFFGSSLNTEAGGNASSTAVRALIKQLVAGENSKKPLSDSQLSQLLEEQGIQVARRTVAKYREALRIAPANLRRQL